MGERRRREEERKSRGKGELTLAEGIDLKPGHFLGQDGFWQVEEGRVVDREIVVIILQDPHGRALDAAGRHGRARGGGTHAERQLAPRRAGGHGGRVALRGRGTPRGERGRTRRGEGGQLPRPRGATVWAQALVNTQVRARTRLNARTHTYAHADGFYGRTR